MLDFNELKNEYEKLLLENKLKLEKIALLNQKVNYLRHKFRREGPVCPNPDEEPEHDSIICYICGWKLENKV